MAKQTTSIGDLVNLKKLDAVIKKTDVLIAGQEDGFTYICNSHWVMRVRLLPDASTRTAIFNRLGRFPADGECFRSGNSESSPYDLSSLKKFFADQFYATCYDTKLTYDIPGDRQLRIFESVDQGIRAYITIEKTYFDMINVARAASKEAKPTMPILFTANLDEAALILPVKSEEIIYLRPLK